jgi:class 3 adenylate cyclase
MNERLNRTSICSVVFLDIIGYTQKSVSEQIEEKERFNAFIGEAIQNVAQNDRIILDTGDGAAIALLGAPEEALFVSLTIRDSILEHNKQHAQHLYARIGINLGPVRVVSDINGQPNIIGDGINVAQRVMSFAAPNQILVTRSYYEVTSRLTKEITQMFSYFGIKQDKHVRDHEIYLIRTLPENTPVKPVTPPNAEAMEAPKPSHWGGSKYWVGGACSLAIVVALFLFFDRPYSSASEVEQSDAPMTVSKKKPVKHVKPQSSDKLTHSIQQGACTQAEMALNQCK